MRFVELPYGPHAKLLRANEAPSKKLTLCLAFVAKQLQALPQVVEARISYQEILVVFKPSLFLHDLVATTIHFAEVFELGKEDSSPKKHHKIWVSYTGPDMAYVMKRTGLSASKIRQLHTSQLYTVHALGFQPGFAFLGTLPKLLQMPRRSVPRVQVPANSVAIAADQTAIYPHASPGGWHIIGLTKREVFDADAPSLSIFQPGDTVQFLDLGDL